MSERACRKCRLISYGYVCPRCKESLSDDFSGLVIVIDEDSAIARAMGVKQRGRYALRVR